VLPPRRYSRLAIAAALLIFPPLGFFLMYKDSHYHRRFSTLLYLGALTPLYLFLVQIWFVAPQLSSVYQGLGAPLPKNTNSIFTILTIISLLQIPLGFVLNHKIKSSSSYKSFMLGTIFVLVTNFFLTSYVISLALNSLLEPIYNLTNYM
jgi:hypothetical protein